MITSQGSSDVFPVNIVNTLYDPLNAIDGDVRVRRRPLTSLDDIQCIGVFPLNMQPDPDSMEMRGIGSPGYATPTLTNYRVNIQGLVKHGDEVEGIAVHSILAKRIYATVARNAALRLALGALTYSDADMTERLIKWSVGTQRYLATEADGLFQFASVTELEFTTQTT